MPNHQKQITNITSRAFGRIRLARLWLFAFLLIYSISLVFLYRFYVASVFPEYPDLNFSLLRTIEVSIISFLIFLSVPDKWLRPSQFYYTMLIVGVFIPMCAIYLWSTQDRSYFYIVIFTVLLIWASIKLPNISFPRLNIKARKILLSLFVLIVVVFLAYLIRINKGHFSLSLIDVYEHRSYFGNMISGVWGYLLPWIGKIIIPMLAGFFLWKKSYLVAFAFSFTGLMLFPLSSHKAYVIFAVMPFVLYLLFRWKCPTISLILALLAGFVVAILMEYLNDNIWGVALLIQRGTFKPALLNFTYASLFKDMEPVMLANSSIMPFIKNPYDVSPPFLVGEFLKGSRETRSNTGFLGTGYAHFGLFGPLIFGIFVSFLLKILDSISKKNPVWLVCVVSIGPFSSLLIMADFLPSLATHGVILCLLILWTAGNLFMNDSTLYSSQEKQGKGN